MPKFLCYFEPEKTLRPLDSCSNVFVADSSCVGAAVQVEDNTAELAALGLPVGFGKHTVSSARYSALRDCMFALHQLLHRFIAAYPATGSRSAQHRRVHFSRVQGA